MPYGRLRGSGGGTVGLPRRLVELVYGGAAAGHHGAIMRRYHRHGGRDETRLRPSTGGGDGGGGSWGAMATSRGCRGACRHWCTGALLQVVSSMRDHSAASLARRARRATRLCPSMGGNVVWAAHGERWRHRGAATRLVELVYGGAASGHHGVIMRQQHRHRGQSLTWGTSLGGLG
jgi:hypothetical protein